MSKPRLIAVIGRQRSGTTVLRQFIGSSRRSFDLGEVFHALTNREASFWGFLHERAAADQAYRFPFHWREAWQEFIQHQRERLSAEVLAFDLKIEYFPIVLRTDGMTASFFFDSPDITYIRLHRRNTAALVISRLMAAATNVWAVTAEHADPERLRRHYQTWGGAPGPERSPAGMTIDPEALRPEMEAIRQQDDAIDRLLGDRFALRVAYEDLFDADGDIASSVAEQIAEACGMPACELDRKPILKRQRAKGVLTDIVNARDIVAAFRGTTYEWMVTDICRKDAG